METEERLKYVDRDYGGISIDMEELKTELKQANDNIDIFERIANNMELELTEAQIGYISGKRHTIKVMLNMMEDNK